MGSGRTVFGSLALLLLLLLAVLSGWWFDEGVDSGAVASPEGAPGAD